MFKFSLVILTSILVGCYSITQYPEINLQTLSKSRVNQSNISVVWHNSVDSINHSCGNKNFTLYGCALPNFNNVSNSCTIHVIEPKNFNDVALLAVLGHEVWHCFGAKHN